MKIYIFVLWALLCGNVQAQPARVTVLDRQIQPHPRLLFTGSEEKAVRRLVKKDTLAGQLYARLLQESDSLLKLPLQSYKLVDAYVPNMLMISREQVYRLLTLSLAWRLSDNPGYLHKAEAELVNVCNYPNWNPPHFLDNAEMTTAVAIAYDWLYAALSEDTRTLAVNAIKTKALPYVVREYEKGGPGSWAKRETNWNVVCNTGMVMGALAIAEEEPILAGNIVQNAVRFLPGCLKHFAPDGVWYEGAAYWGYTNNYLAILLRVLNDNFGNDFGLSDLPGISRTALYYVHSTSPGGKIFNFADAGGTDPDPIPAYFFFSRRYGQPEVASFYRKILTRQLREKKFPRGNIFLALPWFDATPWKDGEEQPKLNVYKSINDIVVLRGNAAQPHSVYLIAKGGDPDAAHQQLDIGTFVVEADGIRWSDDLGADDYDLPGFWDYRPGGGRWKYFRNNNFSHNTLAIDGQLQHSGGIGKIIDYDGEAAHPWCTIDMTSAYKGLADSVCRTFRLIDDCTVEVNDHVDLCLEGQSVTWNMITSADIVCDGNVARLTKDGKEFYLKINSPIHATFLTVPAKTYSDKEKSLTGYQLLQVTVDGVKEMDINITMGTKKQ